MSTDRTMTPHVAIACGGTGGHLFPGIAVGNAVRARGGRVTLFISEKEVDRQAVSHVEGMRIVALPSVGLTRSRVINFLAGLLRSRRIAMVEFREDPPQIVLAMGGFTSAGPVLAGCRMGARRFLHDSNVIPGRANRWLARFSHEVFVAFEEAQSRFKKPTRITGTPVRPEFGSVDAAPARVSLGMRPEDPALLIMGGSQGASAINRLVQESLPALVQRLPSLQFIHLTGTADLAEVRAAYQRLGVKALIQAFCSKMHLALGAATLAISRAGGSSIAEIAATRTPSILIPFPEAAERHQQFNAAALARCGASIVVDQHSISAAAFSSQVTELLGHSARLAAMRERLSNWQPHDAAERIVDAMFARLSVEPTATSDVANGQRGRQPHPASSLNPFSSVAS